MLRSLAPEPDDVTAPARYEPACIVSARRDDEPTIALSSRPLYPQYGGEKKPQEAPAPEADGNPLPYMPD